jgi:hypothetical protein
MCAEKVIGDYSWAQPLRGKKRKQDKTKKMFCDILTRLQSIPRIGLEQGASFTMDVRCLREETQN